VPLVGLTRLIVLVGSEVHVPFCSAASLRQWMSNQAYHVFAGIRGILLGSTRSRDFWQRKLLLIQV
jgi:hypothetical protein